MVVMHHDKFVRRTESRKYGVRGLHRKLNARGCANRTPSALRGRRRGDERVGCDIRQARPGEEGFFSQ